MSQALEWWSTRCHISLRFMELFAITRSHSCQRMPASLMIPAPMHPAINGPTIGTSAYPQSDFPFPLIGRMAWARRGPKSRAGFNAYPVGPPSPSPIAHTSVPQNHGPNPIASPVDDTALLEKVEPTTIRHVVAMISVSRFAGKLRMAGAVQKTPNFLLGSGV